MKIYLATWVNDPDGITLTNKDARRRLTSFHFIKEHKLSGNLLKEWVQTGHLPSKARI